MNDDAGCTAWILYTLKYRFVLRKLLYGSVIGRSALGLRRPPWPVQGDQRVFCVILFELTHAALDSLIAGMRICMRDCPATEHHQAKLCPPSHASARLLVINGAPWPP